MAKQPQLQPPNANRLDATISTVSESDTRLVILSTPVGSTWTQRLQTLLDEGVVDDLLSDEDEG